MTTSQVIFSDSLTKADRLVLENLEADIKKHPSKCDDGMRKATLGMRRAPGTAAS
jgi:hypothetical protein